MFIGMASLNYIFPEEGSCEFDVQALQPSGLKFPRMQGCQLRCPLCVLAIVAGFRDIFNLLVDSWPPGVAPTRALHFYYAQVVPRVAAVALCREAWGVR